MHDQQGHFGMKITLSQREVNKSQQLSKATRPELPYPTEEERRKREITGSEEKIQALVEGLRTNERYRPLEVQSSWPWRCCLRSAHPLSPLTRTCRAAQLALLAVLGGPLTAASPAAGTTGVHPHARLMRTSKLCCCVFYVFRSSLKYYLQRRGIG